MSETQKIIIKPIKKQTPVTKLTVTKAVAVCIKVSNLRKNAYKDLEDWISDADNLYVGRRGRIFITNPETKEKKIFHYKESKWANPYKVGKKTGEYSLEESLKNYQEYLIASDLIKDVDELRGKNLGCFCSQENACHAQILAELANSSK